MLIALEMCGWMYGSIFKHADFVLAWLGIFKRTFNANKPSLLVLKPLSTSDTGFDSQPIPGLV